MSDTYRVRVTREGNSWLADALDLPGAHTWARSLARLDENIREAIALVEALPEGAEADLDIDYLYQIGDHELDDQATAARAERVRIEALRRELARSTEQLAQELVRRRGFSVSDAATLTGVSKQRISQLTSASGTLKAAARAGRTAAKATPPARTGVVDRDDPAQTKATPKPRKLQDA